MTYTRGAALALLVASASLVPLSDASARCWRWHCGGPGILALPFVAAGAVVAGAAAIATAPVRALAGPPGPYYAPPPGYYGPGPGYYGPPPGYYPGSPGPN
jgi:hypothetical protein